MVGFDDVPMAQWVSPPLTTLRQPLAEMATMATKTLLAGGYDGPAEPGGAGDHAGGPVEYPGAARRRPWRKQVRRA